MGHKADKSFFDLKHPWSKRKDVILAYYLEPYLAKVRKLDRPVLLVDGFAGPGKYGDGEIGSPLIMCEKAKAANARSGPEVNVVCIENDPELFDALKDNLAGYDFAKALNGEFGSFVDETAELAKGDVPQWL